MKNKRISAAIMLLLAILCGLLCSCTQGRRNEHSLLTFTDLEFHAGNSKQHISKVQLGVSGGKLYKWVMEKQKLYCYTNGRFQKIATAYGTYGTIHDGHFYYASLAYKLCSYHLESGVHRKLGDLGFYHAADCYAVDDAALAFPTDSERSSYYRLIDGTIAEDTSTHEAYTFGEYTYQLEGDMNLKALIRYDQDGKSTEYESELHNVDMVVFPCSNGLVVTTGADGKKLYYINGASGEIIELFSLDCLGTETTLNIHKDTVYLSVLCYVEHGSLTWKSDPEDVRNGTYCISLSDYRIEKISDEVYSGLFIFDDSGIYACKDTGDVYKLDFNGNVLLALSE